MHWPSCQVLSKKVAAGRSDRTVIDAIPALIPAYPLNTTRPLPLPPSGSLWVPTRPNAPLSGYTGHAVSEGAWSSVWV
jgi:hypothetical protein